MTRRNRPACGSSDFEVTCSKNNTPVLRSSMISGYGFDIISISYEERRLRVADGGKLFLLHARNSCGIPIWNTSAKLGVPFSIGAGNLNLILYNCTEEGAAAAVARRDSELVQTRIRCGNSNKVFVRAGGRYYDDETSDYGGLPYGGLRQCCRAGAGLVVRQDERQRLPAARHRWLPLDAKIVYLLRTGSAACTRTST